MARASATCPAASAVTRSGRPAASTPARRSVRADRDAICATAASSPAAAQEASRRNDAATPASAPSSRSAARASASHPARPGPVGRFSETRPATNSRGSSLARPASTASWNAASSASGSAISSVARSARDSASGSALCVGTGPAAEPACGPALRPATGQALSPVADPAVFRASSGESASVARSHGAGPVTASSKAAKSKSQHQETLPPSPRPF